MRRTGSPRVIPSLAASASRNATCGPVGTTDGRGLALMAVCTLAHLGRAGESRGGAGGDVGAVVVPEPGHRCGGFRRHGGPRAGSGRGPVRPSPIRDEPMGTPFLAAAGGTDMPASPHQQELLQGQQGQEAQPQPQQ
jgi:hypothetical protein